MSELQGATQATRSQPQRRDPFLERAMPSNLEAERMILGCLQMDPSLYEQCEESRLRATEFYVPSHQKIYAAAVEICTAPNGYSRVDQRTGETIYGLDPLILSEELRRRGELDMVGGPAYLASLFDGVPRYSNIANYIQIVQEKARLRRLIAMAEAAINRAFDAETTASEQIILVERDLADVSDAANGNVSHWRAADDVFVSYTDKVEARANSERPVVGLSTGFYGLDRTTLGLEEKCHTIIGARPGIGKTALGLALTLLMSLSRWNLDDRGRPPLIAWFSMEMDAEQLIRRMIAALAGVNSQALHMGRLDADAWRRVHMAQRIFSNLRVFFDDRCGLSKSQVRQALRQLRRNHGRVNVVVTDYLQLGVAENKVNSREQAVAEFCGGMTEIFKEQDIVGISLAQFNRSATGAKPTLADFRESGRIEADANVAIGLHREIPQDHIQTPESHEDQFNEPLARSSATQDAELIVMKSRNGPPGIVRVAFDPSRVWFFEPQRSEENWQSMLERFQCRQAIGAATE